MLRYIVYSYFRCDERERERESGVARVKEIQTRERGG